MRKVKREVNEFKEKQNEINQRIMERFQSLDDQNQTILSKFTSFDDRIKKLETSRVNQETNNVNTLVEEQSIRLEVFDQLASKELTISRLEQLKKISKKFASSTTVYGLNRLVNTKSSLMKTIWTLMSLISLIAGLILTTETIQDYLKQDVFTQTKRIQANSSLLPSVIFCSQHQEPKKLFHRAEFRTKNSSLTLTGEIFEPMDFLEGVNSCLKFNHYHNASSRESNNPPLASSPLLSAVVSDKYQDMFLFEFQPNASFSWLDVYMSDNYLNELDTSDFMVNVKPKADYYFDLTKRIETKLPYPFNDCKETTEFTYRKRNCVSKCKNRRLVEAYNCTLRSYYKIPGYGYCNSELFTRFESVCDEECPQECALTTYDRFTSNYVQEGDLATVKIAYMDLSYIEISQTAKMNVFSLLNEIGGALGLFIGVSFLSALEFVEYFVEVFFVFYK